MAIRTRCDCPLQSLAIPRNDHGRPQFHSLVHGGVSGVPRSRLEATHGWGVADQKLASGQRKKLLPLSLRRFLWPTNPRTIRENGAPQFWPYWRFGGESWKKLLGGIPLIPNRACLIGTTFWAASWQLAGPYRQGRHTKAAKEQVAWCMRTKLLHKTGVLPRGSTRLRRGCSNLCRVHVISIESIARPFGEPSCRVWPGRGASVYPGELTAEPDDTNNDYNSYIYIYVQ